VRAVWKYPLQLIDEPQRVLTPADAQLVHVDGQHDVPCLWFEVNAGDPNAPLPSSTNFEHWFVVHGTGHPIEHGGVFVGTAITYGGDLVWHVYEVMGP
jgi:hypothetical protein